MRRRAVLSFMLIVLGSLTSETFARGGVRVIIDPWLVPVVIGRPPPAPAPVVRPAPIVDPKGFINLDVRPFDASVFLDNKHMGIASKIDYLKVEPGSYTVSIRREGFKSETFEVHIQPGRTIQLDVTLKRLPPVDLVVQKDPTPPPEEVTYKIDLEKTGFLTLQVKPDDAAVYIEDKYVGTVSKFNDADASIVLRAGPHKVQIIRPGFKPYVSVVEIPGDGAHTLSVVLEKE